MARWLVKTEPETWSWDDQVRKGTEPWDGVRNAAAIRNLQAMRAGDRAFFYHSGEEKRIVGIVEVAREHYPDPTDPSGRFVRVDMRTVRPLAEPVTLKRIKAEPGLADMVLVRNARLSVQPVTDEAWEAVCRLGATPPG